MYLIRGGRRGRRGTERENHKGEKEWTRDID